MIFNSFQFLIFLVVVVVAYWQLKLRAQNVLLLVASYLFYGWWDWRFLGLLWLTTIVDFIAGQKIEAGSTERERRGWLIGQVSFNLGILAFFKYFNFFTDSTEHVLRSLGLSVGSPAVEILLPIGISFYVFHEISYAVDIYRRRLTAERNLLTYALFIAYFPLLIAGPIERAWHLIPQLRTERKRPNSNQVYSALVLIVQGLFKKVVIADAVAPIANEMFNAPKGRGAIPLAIGAVAFAIQIYGDFAGYTDIARGVSRLLGIEVFRNFEQPYLSTNITQFWRTWHISLSSWLHDYLYVPLGGNQRGRRRTYINLFLTMLIGGLWHGASWTFVIWGALHGTALAIHRALGAYEPRGRPPLPRWRELPSILGTFGLVTFLWIFFRSASLADALTYIRGFFHGPFGPTSAGWQSNLMVVAPIAILVLVMDLVDRDRARLRPLSWSPAVQGALFGGALVGLLVWSGGLGQPFIYFQF